MPIFNNPFLQKEYKLAAQPEVLAAADRMDRRSEKRLKRNPENLIQNYLDRFKEVTEEKDPTIHEQNIAALARLLCLKFVIKPTDIPEAAFQLEQRIARNLGYGDIPLTDEFRQAKTREITSNQKQSLTKWVRYLASPDAQYPDWAKYWAFRSVLKMGKFVKKADEQGREMALFERRTKGTVSPFPPLNQRALAETVGALQRLLDQESTERGTDGSIENRSKKLDQDSFEALVKTKDFSKIYTQFLLEMPEYSTEGLEETRGEWVKYSQGSNPKPLVDSLDGYPLEWCTANTETAQTQLQGGDFYVYYSLNEEGQPKIPRVAIRMEGHKIAEVRGIAPNQETDPYINPIIEEKMKEFPDGEMYKKKAKDMKQLSIIEAKVWAGKKLNKEELTFLFEIDNCIEGFRHDQEPDPRIRELQSQCDLDTCLPIIFDCRRDQIARSPEKINQYTKAYIGPLFPQCFNSIGHLKYIYEVFPTTRVLIDHEVDFGGQTKELLENSLVDAGVVVEDTARELISSDKFETVTISQRARLVVLRADTLLGCVTEYGWSWETICLAAEELGLELCPPEIAVRLCLQSKDICGNIAMEPIADLSGELRIFDVLKTSHISQLRTSLLTRPWLDADMLIFSLPWDEDDMGRERVMNSHGSQLFSTKSSRRIKRI